MYYNVYKIQLLDDSDEFILSYDVCEFVFFSYLRGGAAYYRL